MRTFFEVFEAPEMVALLLFALIAGSAVLWLQDYSF
jgi:hypothetical protein